MLQREYVMALAYNSLQPVEILLVEDNSGDAELTQDAFEQAKVPNRMHVARNGNEALDFLFRRGRFTDAVRPDLILLDLNMPGKSGKEILSIIKQDELLMDIPVIVLSSSKAPQDEAATKELNASAYIVKPSELAEFLHVVETVDSFWLGMNKLSGNITGG